MVVPAIIVRDEEPMAVDKVVALVRQAQAMVESPELLKENDCLDQVCSFLDGHVDHADSRARLGSARALAQLSSRLEDEDRHRLVLRHAPKVLARLRSMGEHGSLATEDKELLSLLEVVLGDEKKPCDHGICEALPAESRGDSVGPDAEVLRLKVRVAMDEDARTAVRHALVQVGGVVSVTFEGTDRVFVQARNADLVHDHAFAENVCNSVEHKLLTLGAPRQQGRNSVVPEMRGYVDSSDDEFLDDEPVEYIFDDDEDGEGCVMAHKLPDGSYWAGIAKLAKGTAVDPTDGSQGTAVDTTDGSQASQRHSSTDSSVQDCDEEPQYLDESEDEVSEVAPRLSSGYPPSIIPRSAWSFFSQDMWRIGRRIQEYDNGDPTLAARLQRAQLRRQKRQQEEQMRLGRVLSVMTPLRATTMSEAVKQCRQAAYEPRGVE